MTITEANAAEPYVKSSSSSKKKPKKKKSSAAAAPLLGEEGEGVELTASAVVTTDTAGGDYVKSSSSSKKKKSSKKIDGVSKPKSVKKKKSKRNIVAVPDREEARPSKVLQASGWNQVSTSKINAEHVSSGVHKYAITGDESQIVTVSVPPGETVQGEPGSMMYLTSPLTMKVSCGADWFGRCCGGEDCCVLNFQNHTNETGYAALTTNQPLAKVVPVDLAAPEVGGTLIVQQGAYMASYGDVQIGFDCDCNLIRCCCGGMGLVRQKIKGSGTAFLGATGTIVQKVLAEGEVMLVDTNCILAYSDTCTFDLKLTGGIVNWIGGGEGIFNSSLKGPGLAIVQSMNMRMFLECLAAEKMYRR